MGSQVQDLSVLTMPTCSHSTLCPLQLGFAPRGYPGGGTCRPLLSISIQIMRCGLGVWLTLRQQLTADSGELGVQLVEQIVDDGCELGRAVCAGVEAGRLLHISDRT